MKKLLGVLLAVGLMALPFKIQAQTYVAQSGVTFFAGATATATHTATVNIPNKSSEGNLQIVTAGITGSPSGCSLAMYSVSNGNNTAPASAEQTPTFSISTGTNAQLVAAISAADISTDSIKAVYACSVYPTAGLITISFAPVSTLAASSITISSPIAVNNGVLNSGYLNVTAPDTAPLYAALSDGTTPVGAFANYGTSPGAVKVPGVNADVTNTVTVTQATTGNPCENPQVAQSSVVVNISTATTTSLVAVSGSTSVYICGFAATFGASTTMSLEYGTGASCTGTHALTGVMVPGTGAEITLGGVRLATPGSQGVCAVSTGTGGIEGVLSYVQQ